MRQQKKISIYLKGISLVMLAAVVALVAYLSVAAVRVRSQVAGAPWQFIFWTYFYGICCAVILLQFYRICTQIGEDNSFSMVNAKYFKNMELASYAASLGAAIRTVWCLIAPESTVYKGVAEVSMYVDAAGAGAKVLLFISCFELLAFIIFGLLCRALSALVVNAATIKMENELTI